jgi:hypothetical protein
MPKENAARAILSNWSDLRNFRALCIATRAKLRRVAGAKTKKHRDKDVEFFALLVMTAAGVSAAICAPDVSEADTVDLGAQDVAFVRGHDAEFDTIVATSCVAGAAARSQSQKWWAMFLDWCLDVKSCRKAARRFVRYGLGPLCKQLLMIEARRGRPHGALARYLALVCGAPLFGSAHYSLLSTALPKAPAPAPAPSLDVAGVGVHAADPRMVDAGMDIAMGAPSASSSAASASALTAPSLFALTPAERTKETDKVMDAIAVYVHVKSFAGCTCELLAPSLRRLDAVLQTITTSNVRAAVVHAMEAAALAVAPKLHHDETTLPRPLQNLLELLMATTAAAGSEGYQAYTP